MTSSIATNPSVGDQAVVATIPKRIVTAWEAHDANAFAEVFTDDGTMILPGLYKKGRDEIREFMAAQFEGPYKGTRVAGEPVDIRFFGGTVGMLITAGGVLRPGDTEIAAEQAIRASWLVVKKDGTWYLAAYQNSPR
jgi:uncharacterized protein (TIGR02246 family)